MAEMTQRSVTTCACDLRCGDLLDGEDMVVALVTNHVARVVTVTTGPAGFRVSTRMDFDDVVQVTRGVCDIVRIGGH